MGVSPLKKNGQSRRAGEVHTDSTTKCNILADQFKSVFTKDANDTHRATQLYGPSYPQISELIIQEGVRKLLAGINPSKASGPDEIPCRLLRELSDELAPVFTRLFKQTYYSGKLPLPWTPAWISSIFKKGTRSDVSNYTPVSLTCVACKLFEHILCSHIRAPHLDAHGILTPVNHGFHGKHSCESQLLITSHDIYQRLDHGEQIDIRVLDFSKAFDTVPHRRLISKLEFCGISGPIWDWIRAFLTSRTQRVMIDGCHSREDAVDSGVPQGTVLGPLLFLIYISDLPSFVDPGTAVRLFTDDCLIYRSINSEADRLQLQKDLDALSTWGRCWDMKFNTSKCHIMRVGNTKWTRFYHLNNDILTEVDNASYLGVLFTNDMSWSPHISSIVSKANQWLSFIRWNLRRNLRGSPFKCREIAYTSLVRSQLKYSRVIWDLTLEKDANNTERVQRMAARLARGQYGIISVTQLLKDLKWAPLADRRRHHRIILLYKILNHHLAVPPEYVDIRRALRQHRRGHFRQLQRPRPGPSHHPCGIPPPFEQFRSGTLALPQ